MMVSMECTLKETTLVLLVQGKQLSGSFTDLGKGVLDTPYFTLVTQSKLSNKLQLLVQTLLLIRASRGGVSLAVAQRHSAWHLDLYGVCKLITLTSKFCAHIMYISNGCMGIIKEVSMIYIVTSISHGSLTTWFGQSGNVPLKNLPKYQLWGNIEDCYTSNIVLHVFTILFPSNDETRGTFEGKRSQNSRAKIFLTFHAANTSKRGREWRTSF